MIDREENGLRIPPHSIESEQSVLGGLMLSPKSWDDIAEIITERDFYRVEHQLIYRHIVRLIENGQQVDVITVAESIESTGKLDKIGGLPYLGEIVQNVPSAANIRSYANIVAKKRKERDFNLAVNDLADISESAGEIENKIELAVSALTALADSKQDEPIRLSEATAKTLEGIEYRYGQGGDIHGLKTGFIDINRITGGLQKGDLIILAGRPSMGKTALASNIAESVALDNKTVLFFSLEMSDEQLATRALANQGSVSMATLRSARMQDSDWNGLTSAIGRVAEIPFFIDSNSSTSAGQMHVRARRMQRKYGLDLIVIDYLQLMSGGGENRNNDLAEITRKLKFMAKDLRVPVLCLSQLNRGLEQRTNKRPIMADLRDSGAIEQDADVIAFIYRDEVYNSDSPNKGLAELIFSKQRMGAIGTVYLTFQGEYSRFQDFAGQYHQAEYKPARRGFSDGKTLSAGQ